MNPNDCCAMPKLIPETVVTECKAKYPHGHGGPGGPGGRGGSGGLGGSGGPTWPVGKKNRRWVSNDSICFLLKPLKYFHFIPFFESVCQNVS